MVQSRDELLPASPWVLRFAPLLRPEGVVLDLACGSGRHALALGALGHRVVAVDRDRAALEGFAAHEKHIVDLEAGGWPFDSRRFDGIVVTNYLHRPLLAQLPAALATDGVLIYETFAEGNGAWGRPSNPDFLLAPGELLDAARGLRIVAFEEGYVAAPKSAFVQRICAVRHEGKPPSERYKL
jgi:SAM-dependent methyltransferase